MNMPIPFLNISDQCEQIYDEIERVLQEVIKSTAFSNGPFVKEFEKNFAAYCSTKYALGVNSGTSALHLGLIVLGINEGDEVILPANTFIATAWSISYVNATPVFVDCDPNTWNIDPDRIEEKITSRTKAIIGVHLYGQPFDIDSVKQIADRHGLYLVEDAAQAHGAMYRGKRVGGFGEMGCFSFYPGKNLGAFGEGGGIVTNNEMYYKHINRLRDHGSEKKYYHDEIGFNMRMDGIQGAILNVKLKYLDVWNNRRKEIAMMYQQEITNSKIKMQTQPEWCDPVYHLFVITTDNRDKLMGFMQENDIYPGMHYPVPCHLQKAYSSLRYKKGDFPNTEYLAEHCLSLPMFPELTDKQIGKVIGIINKF